MGINRYQYGMVYEFDKSYYTGSELLHFGNICLNQIGELYCEEGYKILEHKQWCHEISYIVSGKATFFIDDKAYTVNAGDVFLCSCGQRHAIHANQNTQLRYMYMGFNFEGECRDDTENAIRHFFGHIEQPIKRDMVNIGGIFHQTIREFYTDSICFDQIVGAYLQLMLLFVYRNFNYSIECSILKEMTVEVTRYAIYTIICYVEDNIIDIKNIRQIADKLGYSYTYISHLFKNKTGVTLQQFITDKKMEAAVKLMMEQHLTISEVSERLGYHSIQAFSKAFKRVYDKSPQNYMASIKQNHINQLNVKEM